MVWGLGAPATSRVSPGSLLQKIRRITVITVAIIRGPKEVPVIQSSVLVVFRALELCKSNHLSGGTHQNSLFHTFYAM